MMSTVYVIQMLGNVVAGVGQVGSKSAHAVGADQFAKSNVTLML